MRLYYSIVDPFPAYRSDLAELFGVELRKLGLETEWYMASSHGQVHAFTPYQDQKIHLPLNLSISSKFLARLSYWFTDLFHVCRQSNRGTDALQCRDKYLTPLVALIVAKLRGIPFFYWCSYPFPEQDRLVAETKSGWRYLLGWTKAEVRFFLLYKVICPLADHVFVQSPRMKDDMGGYGIPLNKMTPVPMGVSARIFEWVRSHPASVVPQRIVYLGSLASVRRLDMLLDAFLLVKQSFPAAQLMFVGDGDHPSERRALEVKADTLELSESVVFTGFVSMEEAWTLAASAAVCVSPIYPSSVLAPASPTKLVEYMALGRPVVCNDHPEQSQIIKECGAGLCVEWSATAFADAISELLLDPAGAEERASRGPAWVAANRTYPMIAKQVWAKYRELMGQPQ